MTAPHSLRTGLSILVLTLTGISAPRVEAWTAQLQGGGEVHVDPQTRRPTVTIDGKTTQLWDGVHILKDGEELTVESGRVVPNKEILQATVPKPPPARPPVGTGGANAVIIGLSPCEELVKQVCGPQGKCSESRGCDPARQLLAMEAKERQASGTPNRTTYTSGKCREALKDRFFAACDKATSAAGVTGR
jgi:hypothetical protein